MILTEEYAVDLELFTQGKADRPSIVTRKRCPVKNALGWNAVVFCACTMIQLRSVVFDLVTAVHKFDFRLVINKTRNKWRPVEGRPCSDSDSRFWQYLYALRPNTDFRRGCLRDSTHAEIFHGTPSMFLSWQHTQWGGGINCWSNPPPHCLLGTHKMPKLSSAFSGNPLSRTLLYSLLKDYILLL
jgi:hypothetical protein